MTDGVDDGPFASNIPFTLDLLEQQLYEEVHAVTDCYRARLRACPVLRFLSRVFHAVT